MRKVLLILAGVIFVVVIGAVIVISQIDVSDYKEQALAQVEKATGRKASIEGDLDLSISLTPAIVAEGIRFANADWGSRADMATIKRIEVKVALLPLLTGAIEVQRFILIEPDVLLEKNAAGKGNWELGTATNSASQEAQSSEEMTAIDIGTVLVKNLKLVYRDAASEKPVEFSIDTLKLDTIDSDKLEVELKAALDKNSIAVNGTIGSLKNLFDNNEYPIDITASIGAAKTSLKGVISEPLLAKGFKIAASLNVEQLDQLNTLTGGELPAMGPLTLTTNISDTNGKYVLKDISMRLEDTELSGELIADISGKVPYVTASLQSPLLNLIPFQPDPPAEAEKVDRYLSDEPIALNALKTANADISIKVSEVRTRQATLTNFDTSITLNNGNLEIKPLSVNVGKGKVTGNVNINASQSVASVNVNLDGKSVELGQLEQLKETFSGGPTNITLEFRGKGNTSQALAGNANGKLLLQVGAGEVKRDEENNGFLASIGRLLNPFSAKDNAMLECAVLNFNLKDGIATANKGIGIETQQITVSGGGDINLKNEKLSLGFEPHAKGAVAGAITNLASGMMASGTLANPKVKINPAGVAMGALKSVAGVAGGAGSLIGGIFGKDDSAAAADSAPCKTALSGKSTPVKTQQTSSPSKVNSVKKDALESSKKLLKGLFD